MSGAADPPGRGRRPRRVHFVFCICNMLWSCWLIVEYYKVWPAWGALRRACRGPPAQGALALS